MLRASRRRPTQPAARPLYPPPSPAPCARNARQRGPVQPGSSVSGQWRPAGLGGAAARRRPQRPPSGQVIQSWFLGYIALCRGLGRVGHRRATRGQDSGKPGKPGSLETWRARDPAVEADTTLRRRQRTALGPQDDRPDRGTRWEQADTIPTPRMALQPRIPHALESRPDATPPYGPASGSQASGNRRMRLRSRTLKL